MKLRPYAVTAVLAAAAISVGVVAPAHAAAPAPVTSVTIAQSQTGHSWVVDASWNDTGASDYLVAITDHADGSITPGIDYDGTDTVGTTARLVTGDLIAGHDYWVSVRARNGSDPADESAVFTQSFTAVTLDTTAPTGTFALDKTQGWVAGGFFGFRGLAAFSAFRGADIFDDEESDVVIRVKQLTLADNTTSAAQITRRVRIDAGAPLKTWTGSGPTTLGYSAAGTFHPEAVLTDKYGNSRTVALGTVRILSDPIGPRVRIIYPPVAHRWTVGSWQVVRGTSRDGASGNGAVLALVVERRDAVWFGYDFEALEWKRGTTNLQKTMEETLVTPAIMIPGPHNHWRTPRIHGLQRGMLHVETVAFDNAGNLRMGPKVHHFIH